jgi:hypothetical protein
VADKIKRKINWWLEDSEFLSKSNFHDLYYMETVCKYVSNMIKNIPIPVLTSYDTKNKSIYFSVGKNKKGFKLDIDIAYYDYITLTKRWLSRFFPTYEIEIESEIGLSEEEIAILIKDKKEKKEKIDYNDILLLRKKVSTKEKGTIEKITMMKDEFILNVDGKRQIRISGVTYKPKSLSMFMDELKVIATDIEKREFIFNNSSFIKNLDEGNNKELSVNYQGKQMLSFFQINYEDLKNEHLQMIDNFNYKWGKFKIKFESLSLKNDCISFYNKMQEGE